MHRLQSAGPTNDGSCWDRVAIITIDIIAIITINLIAIITVSIIAMIADVAGLLAYYVMPAGGFPSGIIR